MSNKNESPTPPEVKQQLGATGEFPQGQISEDDEGGLQLAVGVHEGSVFMDFGKNISWFAFNAQEALDLASVLIEKARMANADDVLEIKL